MGFSHCHSMAARTLTSITLNEIQAPGQTVLYAISTTNDIASVTSWQTERVFSDLVAETTYYFFAKAQATLISTKVYRDAHL